MIKIQRSPFFTVFILVLFWRSWRTLWHQLWIFLSKWRNLLYDSYCIQSILQVSDAKTCVFKYWTVAISKLSPFCSFKNILLNHYMKENTCYLGYPKFSNSCSDYLPSPHRNDSEEKQSCTWDILVWRLQQYSVIYAFRMISIFRAMFPPLITILKGTKYPLPNGE